MRVWLTNCYTQCDSFDLVFFLCRVNGTGVLDATVHVAVEAASATIKDALNSANAMPHPMRLSLKRNPTCS